MDNFLLEHEVPSVGVLVIGWRSLCLGFQSTSRHLVPCCFELAMDFPRQQHSQLFGMYMTMSVEPFHSATTLSKEASDENLWKPTPSRRKLRNFVRTGSHVFVVRHNCLDVLLHAPIFHVSLYQTWVRHT